MSCIDHLRDVLGNGPVHIGIAQGSDVPETVKYAFTDLSVSAISSTIKFDTVPKNLKEVLVAAVRILFVHPTIIEDGYDIKASSQDGDLIHDGAAGKALSLMCATKLNWWHMNHHTGTDKNKVQGYAGKLLAAYGKEYNEDPSSCTKAVWAIGHMYSTKKILVELGFAGINTNHIAGMQLALGKDMLYRVRSNPAGTARVANVASCIRLIASSLLKNCIPFTSEMSDVIKTASAITMNPSSYHIGASYLTGQACLKFSEPTDELVSVVKTAVLVLYPNSSLARSPVLANAPEDREIRQSASAFISAYATAIANTAKDMDVDVIAESWDAMEAATAVSQAPNTAAAAPRSAGKGNVNSTTSATTSAAASASAAAGGVPPATTTQAAKAKKQP